MLKTPCALGTGRFTKFNTILTNPPFGANIKVLKSDAAFFKLGHVWRKDATGEWLQTTKDKDTEPQILFVERCLDMLEDGGTLAIVLPETIFHAPNSRYVLNYIKQDNNIKAIVDLAHNTFRPHNNAKTLLIILQKGIQQQDNIVMAVTEETGHDHQGRTLYRFDPLTHRFTDEVWDDTKIIQKELQDIYNPDNSYVFDVRSKDIVRDIFVPRYYWQKRTQSILTDAEKAGYEPVRI